jgi:precorrin-6B methylase 2
MSSVALLTIIFSWSFGITTADGQAFRGSAGGPRSPGVFAQTAPTAIQSRQGFVNTPGAAGAPIRSFAPTQSVQTQTIAPIPVHHPVRHSNHRGTVFVTPPLTVSQWPVLVPGFVPHHYHRPGFFPRHPGVAIVEWPYAYSPTVIIEVAPGVISTAPRYREEPPSDARTRSPGQLAPFDPTPQEVVERMLLLANVKSGDVLYDLGAGDGRVVITAAKKYGIRAVGFEIDPGLVKLARENARQQGVKQLVEIREQDFLTADLSRASVVTLYLSYDGNLALRPQLMKQLRPGARIVSYTFDMGEWQPKISETYRDAGGEAHAIYFWQIGDTIAFR